MKNAKEILENALKDYNTKSIDIRETKRAIENMEFIAESKLKEEVDKVIHDFESRATNENIKRFIPSIKYNIDSTLAAKVLMEIAPIVELDIGDKVTKKIKTLSHKYNGQGEIITFRYESLLYGLHYIAYALDIFIDNDTVTRISEYSYNSQI